MIAPGAGVHAVTTYADAAATLRDPRRFSSAPMRAADPHLLGADGTAHTRARACAASALGRRVPETDDLRAVAAALLHRIAERGTGDLVADVTRPLAATALTRWLGLPPQEAGELDRAVRAAVPGGGADTPDGSLVTTLAAGLLAAPVRDDDPLAPLHHAELPPGAARSVVRILLIAGLETTARFTAALAVRLLDASPAPTPAAHHAFIEETLRCDGPVRTVLRRTTSTVRLDDTVLPAGTVVACRLSAANRDARAFADPQRFDPGRRGPGHLAFGAGPHRCPGAGLARREGAALAAALAELPIALRPAGEPEPTASPFLHGPDRVPVSLR